MTDPLARREIQTRCPIAHPRHGQCQLYDRHQTDRPELSRHRTGSLTWFTDDEAAASGAPPLTSYAGITRGRLVDDDAEPVYSDEEIVGLCCLLAAVQRGPTTDAPEVAAGRLAAIALRMAPIVGEAIRDGALVPDSRQTAEKETADA